jgi:hypothetical protein
MARKEVYSKQLLEEIYKEYNETTDGKKKNLKKICESRGIKYISIYHALRQRKVMDKTLKGNNSKISEENNG